MNLPGSCCFVFVHQKPHVNLETLKPACCPTDNIISNGQIKIPVLFIRNANTEKKYVTIWDTES